MARLTSSDGSNVSLLTSVVETGGHGGLGGRADGESESREFLLSRAAAIAQYRPAGVRCNGKKLHSGRTVTLTAEFHAIASA